MDSGRLHLETEHLKQVMRRYLERLREHRDHLNGLNVYPVPDGDTGTNMVATVATVVDAIETTDTMADFSHALAHGSLMGGQGNSGVILSQILGGLADVFRGESSVGVVQLVEALDRASAAAYRAVAQPVEGTILTVLREASDAARDTGTTEGGDLADLLRAVYARAESALRRTPDLLPALKSAGVVDAGAAGLLLLFGAFVEEVTGERVVAPDVMAVVADPPAVEPSGVIDLRYEVTFLLESDDEASGDRLRTAWGPVGDSIVVVGGGGTWRCHIHTDDIGAAIEAGIDQGRPRRIKVVDLLEQWTSDA